MVKILGKTQILDRQLRKFHKLRIQKIPQPFDPFRQISQRLRTFRKGRIHRILSKRRTQQWIDDLKRDL